MTKQEWLNYVHIHQDNLQTFIRNYHPVNLFPHNDDDMMYNITAVQAERACERVRNIIRSESLDNPDIQFKIALQKEYTDVIGNLLQAAWFGVPESTSCWNIVGFKEAVDLLEDPIEEEEFLVDN